MKKVTKILIITLVILIVVVIGISLSYVFNTNGELKTGKRNLGVEAEGENNNTIMTSENAMENQIQNEVKNENTENTTNNSTTNSEIKSDDIKEKNTERVAQLLNAMTIEEKVGQMFLARYPEEDANTEILEDNPGGYILFGRDFKGQTKNSIKSKLEKNQENSKIKMILGVDEEGGTVVRVSQYLSFRLSKFKSPQQLFKIGGLEKIIEDSHEKTNLLKSIGLNMNLVPVVDLPTKSDSFMYDRSYGKTAKETAEYTKEIIKAMNEDKILSSMKHFPGYGDNSDTHTGIAIDERDYSQFAENDFEPFKAGIEAGAPTILVNHNIVKCMDENMPASLSTNVHKILREDLKFNGIIITDDLAMDAVSEYVENGQAAVQAVKAGNDMIISSDFVKQKKEVLEAVKDGKISEETINRAVRRILLYKIEYEII